MMCAELSVRAYSPTALGQPPGSIEAIHLPAVPLSARVTEVPDSFHATLVHSQLCNDASEAEKYVQYGIWYVQHVGYVVAFRGTQDGFDWLANLKISRKQLEGPTAASEVFVHEGIYTRAIAALGTISKIIQGDAGQRPERMRRLQLTGEDLLLHAQSHHQVSAYPKGY